MHTVIIGPEVIRNTVFEQFCCVNGLAKRQFKIGNNKVGNKIYNGTWELVESGELLYLYIKVQLSTHTQIGSAPNSVSWRRSSLLIKIQFRRGHFRDNHEE